MFNYVDDTYHFIISSLVIISDPRLVQLFDGQVLPSSTKSSGSLVGQVLLSNITKFLKEAVAVPTWIQSTIYGTV